MVNNTQAVQGSVAQGKTAYEPTDSIIVYQGEKARTANSKCWKLMLTFADVNKKPQFINDVVAFKTKTGGFRIVKSRGSEGMSFANALASL